MSSNERLRGLNEQEYLALGRAQEVKQGFSQGRLMAIWGARLAVVALVGNLIRDLVIQLDGSPCQVFANNLRVLVDPAGFYSDPDFVIVRSEVQLLDNQLGGGEHS